MAGQAVRGERPKHNSTTNKTIRNTNKSDYFSSLVVFLVIVSFEFVVCWRGFHFFRGESFDWITALVLSVGCEVLYMYASSKSDIRLVVFRFVLLSLSMTFLCYSTYKSDENLLAYKLSMKNEVNQISSEITQTQNQLKRIENELTTLDGSMKVYIKHDLVTKGIKSIAPEKKRLSKERELAKMSLKGLKEELKTSNQSTIKLNIGDTFKILTIKSYVTLATFLVFQTLICIILPDILSNISKREGE